MKLVYLGTSGAMPAVERGLTSTVLAMDKEYIMVDCGDGNCRQYLKSNLGWNKPMTILFTHMHSDHSIGILGLLQSMDLVGRKNPITIYGIRAIERFITNLHRNQQVKFGYDFNIIEVDADENITLKSGIKITTCESKHSIKPSLAYRIQLPDKEGKLDIDRCIQLGVPKNSPLLGELKSGKSVTVQNETGTQIITSNHVVGKPQKGKVICFSGDTRPTKQLVNFFKDADFLTHEATFLEDEKPNALKAKHSTAKEAGEVAREANVGKLILNHFSARHASTVPIYEEVRKEFSNVVCAEDFMEIELD
jgi:ribonuclease Z